MFKANTIRLIAAPAQMTIYDARTMNTRPEALSRRPWRDRAAARRISLGPRAMARRATALLGLTCKRVTSSMPCAWKMGSLFSRFLSRDKMRPFAAFFVFSVASIRLRQSRQL